MAVPETPAAQIVLPLGFRFARSKRVETDEGTSGSSVAAVAVANPAPPIVLPNLEAAPAQEAIAKQPEVPLAPLANPTVQAEAGTPRSGELAFAAKLMPMTGTEPQAITATAPKNPEPALSKPQFPVSRVTAPETVSVLSAPAAAQPHHQTAEAEHKTEAREIPRPLEIPPEPALSKPAEGLRDISLRLVDGSKEQVEVRLFERAGELRVSVRSADPQLNTELRSGLGDLAGKLEKTGFQTETWHPANEHTKPAEAAAHTGNSKQEPEPRQHAGQQHPERREQRSTRRTRPSWVEEMSRDFPIGDESR